MPFPFLVASLLCDQAIGAEVAGFTTVGVQAGPALPSAALGTSAMGTLQARSTAFGYDEAWLHAGLDAALGASIARGGFVYELGLRSGPGHWLTDTVAVGVYTGIGIDGVTSRLPFALSTPAGVAAQVNVGSSVSLFLQGHAAWNLASARTGGPTPLSPDAYLGRLLLGLGPPEEGGDSWLVVGGSWRAVEGANVVLVEVGTGQVEAP